MTEQKKKKHSLEYFLRGVMDIYRMPTAGRLQEESKKDYDYEFYLDPDSEDKNSELYYGLGVGFSAVLNTLSSLSLLLNKPQISFAYLPAGICIMSNFGSIVHEGIRFTRNEYNG